MPSIYDQAKTLMELCIAESDLKALPAIADLAMRHRPDRHSADFTSVLWHGTQYRFTACQGHIVHLLWDAFENGTPDVRQEALLDAAGSESANIIHLFKDHPAWGALITSRSKGTYRLRSPQGDCIDLAAKALPNEP